MPKAPDLAHGESARRITSRPRRMGRKACDGLDGAGRMSCHVFIHHDVSILIGSFIHEDELGSSMKMNDDVCVM